MSLATDIASIDSEVISNVPVAENLITSIQTAVEQPSAGAFHKALNIVGAIAMATQSVPNADVQAIGGLAGIIAALLNLIPAHAANAAAATAASTAITAAAATPAAVPISAVTTLGTSAPVAATTPQVAAATEALTAHAVKAASLPAKEHVGFAARLKEIATFGVDKPKETPTPIATQAK